MKDLALNIIEQGITKVTLERFETLIRHFDKINSLEGDIVECGIWKGGMGVFLSKMFEDRNIWLADSFEGFEDQKDSTYQFSGERHQKGRMAIDLDTVKSTFKKYQLENDHVKFLKGFVKDTLPGSGIGEIALLRVDVDTYSATRDTLDNLYNKVVPGGFIIFDDTCLFETQAALKDFIKEHNISYKLLHPVTDQEVDINNSPLPCGCYLIKQ